MSIVLSAPAVPLPRHSSPFGPRNGTHHNGVDFPCPHGSPLLAMCDGVVRFAGTLASSPPSGIAVGVDGVVDGHDVFFSFSHCSAVAVRPGEHVVRGQVLAYCGNTGEVRPVPTPEQPLAGTHVHVRVDVDGRNVDPLPLIRGGSGGGAVLVGLALLALKFYA